MRQAEALHYLQNTEGVLSNIISIIELPTIDATGDVFHDLMSCILEQQIHYRSTKKVFQKMLQVADIEKLTLDNFDVFEKKALPTAKLTANKYETILQTIEFFTDNKIDWYALSDAEIRKTLSQIKGIGTWTMDMILLYTLQRPDVFPYDDFHLKEIMVKLYELNPNVRLKSQMLDVANEWGEHKSLAVKYLLAWKEFNKKGGK